MRTAVAALLLTAPLPAADPLIPHERWTVSAPLLKGGPPGGFDEVAVKDPSVVFFDGKYHVFYTSKPKRGSKEFGTALGYVAAPTLEGLASATRVEMKPIVGDTVIAPQVFYFAPQKLWYLVAHVPVGSLRKLTPVYLTNKDINDVNGWSKPQPLTTSRKDKDGFWIDFWVICDDATAHLFYTDHTYKLYRMECPLAEFPGGFERASEVVAFEDRGEKDGVAWHLHEAVHIYRVKSAGTYLAILEGAFSHPTRKNYWDSRNRYLFAAVADKLEGPWRRAEAGPNEFLGDPAKLVAADGRRYTAVSHPELIRSGSDQRLEIEDCNLKMLAQVIDGSKTPTDYNYDDLPWELVLMRNQ